VNQLDENIPKQLRGRPRKYETDSDRKKAYRDRQKEKIHQIIPRIDALEDIINNLAGKGLSNSNQDQQHYHSPQKTSGNLSEILEKLKLIEERLDNIESKLRFS